MIQIIQCKECGGEVVENGQVCVNVVFSKGDWCDKCRQGHTEKQSHFFCSVNCFNRFMIKVVDGKVEDFHWKSYDSLTGQSIDPV